MPEKRIYFTTEDVERVLDSIEDQLDEENGGILSDFPPFPADIESHLRAIQPPPYAPSRAQSYKPPCERRLSYNAGDLLTAAAFYIIAILAAIGIGVVASIVGGLFR